MKKSAFILLFFLFIPLAIYGAGTKIPVVFPQGTGLEDCIRKNLNNSSKLQPVYVEDALKLNALECSDPNITSFEGIEPFQNLTFISMGYKGTQIDNLSYLVPLAKLVRISLPRSNITDISPLASMPRLTYLDLSENHVTDLTPLDNLTQLSTLILYHQGPDYITDITPLDNLTNMYILNLEANKITDITPLEHMQRLQYLHIGDNRITSIQPLDNITNLRFVNFNINIISDLTPLISSQNITTLYANNNRITSLKFLTEMRNVTHLSLNQNFITSIDEVALLPYPVLLSFDQNGITSITTLKNTIRNGWLKELGIAYNCIPNLDLMSLHLVSIVRREHQCEPHPLPNEYSLATIVNGDLLQQAPPDPDNPTNPELLEKVSTPSGPGGCSISYGGGGDINLPVALLALFGILVRRNLLKRGKNNDR